MPPGTSPAERYMLGRLVPRQQPEEPADDEQLEPELVDREVASPASGDDGEEEGAEADATVRSGSMSASAIGLAFSVPATVDVISVVAKWGRYERSPSETHETPTGRAAVTWHRVPAGGSVEVRTDAEGSDSLVPDDEQPGVVVRYTVRHRGARRVVELALVNGQRTPAQTQDTARLYQVGLTVTALDGNTAIFCGHNDPDIAAPLSGSDDERLHLELLHRATRMYANGRQCAVDASVRDGETRAWRLSTTCFPAAEVQLVVPGKVPGLVLDMARLGSPELGRDDLVRALRPLMTGYRKWLTEQASRVESDPEIARYSGRGAARRGGSAGRGGPPGTGDRAAADGRDRAGGVPVREPGDGAAAGAVGGGAGADVGTRRGRGRAAAPPGRAGEPVLAAVPACVRAAVPAGADRSRLMPTRTGAWRSVGRRGPAAVLPDRRWQDRGVPGAGGVHVRDPAAPGRGRLGSRRL